MALATRELELIIIARDSASSTFARIGGAMAILGTGIARMGIKWAGELNQMAMEAAEFSNSAALAFTQMFDKTGAKIEDVEDMLLRVAREVPRPIESLSEALFDIFSSIDVGIGEAENILKRVGDAAVAGQTDVRAAMIPTIAVMNAYKLSAENIDEILDIQFKTVQKGILTYEELTQNIGKVIPAAVAAGQSFTDMSAAYAFLTRNGLNAAMSATSVARAMELLARPQTVKNLEEYGIKVRNAAGEFLPLNEIITQLGRRMDDLTAPQRKQAFQDLFGTGTIQARRFFDLAIPNYEDLAALTDEFGDSAGSMQAAYDVMFKEPQAQIDLMKNRLAAFRIELGERVLKTITERLLPIGNKLLAWWESLSDKTKDQIANFVQFAAIGTIVVGALIAGAGAVMLAIKAFSGMGSIVGKLVSGFVKFNIWVLAIAGAAYLVYKNWDKIVAVWNGHVLPAIKKVWGALRPLVEGLKAHTIKTFLDTWQSLKTTWQGLLPTLQDIASKIRMQEAIEWMRSQWPKVRDIITKAFEAIRAIITHVSKVIRRHVQTLAKGIKWVWEKFGPEIVAVVSGVWRQIKNIFEAAFGIIEGLLDTFIGVLTGDWERAGEGLKQIWDSLVGLLVGTWNNLWQTISDVTERAVTAVTEWLVGVWNGIKTWWMNLWAGIRDWFIGIWTSITTFLSGIWNTVSGIFMAGINVIKTIWNTGWNTFKTIIQKIWNSGIVKFLRDVFGIIREIFRIAVTAVAVIWAKFWGNIFDFVKDIWNKISEWLTEKWDAFKELAREVWNKVKTNIQTAVTATRNLIMPIWNAIRDKISSIWNTIRDWASAKWTRIREIIGTAVVAMRSKIFEIWTSIRTSISNIWDSIKTKASTIWGNIRSVAADLWGRIKSAVMGPTDDIKSGFSDLVTRVIDKLKQLWDKAVYYVGKIRATLKKIDPREWFSPPITATVGKGMSVLSTGVLGDLKSLSRGINQRVTDIRNQMGSIGGETPPVAMNGTGGGGNTYNVETSIVARGVSATQLLNELNWRLKVGGPTYVSGGGVLL